MVPMLSPDTAVRIECSLFQVEYENRHLIIHAKRKCGGIHYRKPFFQDIPCKKASYISPHHQIYADLYHMPSTLVAFRIISAEISLALKAAVVSVEK